MSRHSACRARESRQLDFFNFSPVVRPVDRSPPPESTALPLRVVPAPVVELPEIRFESEPSPPAATAISKSSRFTITYADRLGEGSMRQKCEANLTAIALLQRLETERRFATEAEQRTLVRYVGWGGLPQVFDSHNAEWRSQRERLETLLTPDELTSARATTLNAHYTSATIIRAMYAALDRFGFTGGRVLEPACGLGHFLSHGALAVLNEWLRTRPAIDALAEFYSVSTFYAADAPELLRLASERLIAALALGKKHAAAFRAQTECQNADIAFESGYLEKALRDTLRTLGQLERIRKQDPFVRIRIANAHAVVASLMTRMNQRKEAKFHAGRAVLVMPEADCGFGTSQLKQSILYKCCFVFGNQESKADFFNCFEKLKAVEKDRVAKSQNMPRASTGAVARGEQAIERISHYWTRRLQMKNTVIEAQDVWYRLSAGYDYADTLVAAGQSDEAQAWIERILCDAREHENPRERQANFAEALLVYAARCRNWGLSVRAREVARMVVGMEMKRYRGQVNLAPKLKAAAWVFWGECMIESGNLKAAQSAGRKAVTWMRQAWQIDYELEELLKRVQPLFSDKRLRNQMINEIRKILPDTRLFVTVGSENNPPPCVSK